VVLEGDAAMGIKQRRVAFCWKFLWIRWHPWARISCAENPVALCCEVWIQRAEDPGPAFGGVFGAQDMLRVIGFSILSLPATNNTISAQQPLMPIHRLKKISMQSFVIDSSQSCTFE
jgi:hypothetical protein